MGAFIPLVSQRDNIYNRKGFISVMKKNTSELSNSILVIKDVKFSEKLTICCDYSNHVINEYNKLFKRASGGFMNNLNQDRLESIKIMNDRLVLFNNELALLKELL